MPSPPPCRKPRRLPLTKVSDGSIRSRLASQPKLPRPSGGSRASGQQCISPTWGIRWSAGCCSGRLPITPPRLFTLARRWRRDVSPQISRSLWSSTSIPCHSDPDELAAREKEYYIGRKAIAKAERRLQEKLGVPADKMAAITSFLNKGYDSYVHGTNQSAMELYSGRTHGFMLRGHDSARHVCMAKTSVAGKLKEFLNSLRTMAITRGAATLQVRIIPRLGSTR